MKIIAGRNGTANHMNVGEYVVHDRNIDQHVQLGNSARWGDYSSMSIDPVTDSCWYTQEYASPNTRCCESSDPKALNQWVIGAISCTPDTSFFI